MIAWADRLRFSTRGGARTGPRAGGLRVLAFALVLALIMPVTLACGAREAEPVDVARTFAATARRGDVAGMLAVVEQGTVDRLELAAEQASDQVGGRRGINAAEMLQIVGVDRTLAVAEATLLEEDEKRARVELTMTDGRQLQLDLVWEAPVSGDEDNRARSGGWKVRIPLPEPQAPTARVPDA